MFFCLKILQNPSAGREDFHFHRVCTWPTWLVILPGGNPIHVKGSRILFLLLRGVQDGTPNFYLSRHLSELHAKKLKSIIIQYWCARPIRDHIKPSHAHIGLLVGLYSNVRHTSLADSFTRTYLHPSPFEVNLQYFAILKWLSYFVTAINTTQVLFSYIFSSGTKDESFTSVPVEGFTRYRNPGYLMLEPGTKRAESELKYAITILVTRLPSMLCRNSKTNWRMKG